jgi:hypothetical protein
MVGLLLAMGLVRMAKQKQGLPADEDVGVGR